MKEKILAVLSGVLLGLAVTACSSAGQNDRNSAASSAAEKTAEETNADVPIDEEHFPDEKFRVYVSRMYDKNEDGVLSQKERSAVRKLHMEQAWEAYYEYQIATEEESLDVTGISNFYRLKEVQLRFEKLSGTSEIEKLSRLKILRLEGRLTERELLVPEFNTLEELEVESSIAAEIDIRCLPNLKRLILNGAFSSAYGEPYDNNSEMTGREHIDLSCNKELQYLQCSNMGFKTLDVSKNPRLKTLICDENQLQKLDVSCNTALRKLSLKRNKIKSLDLTKNKELRSLACDSNQMKTLNLQKNKKLRKLYCGDNKLRHLELSRNTKLKSIRVAGNELRSLDVTALRRLRYLDCYKNKLAGLDVSMLPKLEALNCYENRLTELRLHANLEDLSCTGNRLSVLDCSRNQKLDYLSCGKNKMKMLKLSLSALCCCREDSYYYFLNFLGNKIHTIDIRTVTRLTKDCKKNLPFWLCGGKPSGTGKRIQTLIASENLSGKDLKFLKKLTARYGVTLQRG